jgi:fatty-acyl-CoA synthase
MTQLTTSYVHGASDLALRYQTIGDALDEAAAKWPANEALVSCHQNIRWTYAELKARADEFAAGLIALGLAPGERIGIWAPNCAEWALTQFATAKAGLILVNINPAYRLSELEYALNKVGCRALVTAATFKSSNYLEMLRTLAPELAQGAPGKLKAAKLPQLETVIRLGNERTAGMMNFDDVPAAATPAAREAVTRLKGQLQPDDAINIQFTSGTTGAPKGATLTHFNILNNGRNVAAAQGFTDKDRLCIPVPLYHCFGMVMGNLGCVTHGATMVYPSDAFEPGAVLRAIQAERCTTLYGVPTMFVAELDHPEFDRFDLASLRTGVMAGAPCPIEVMKKVVARMHMRDVTICYGMTETSPVSFQSRADDPIEKRVATVGRIHPHVEVKIVDEHGRTVGVGQRGELLTRGYSVMLGYWDDKEKTREAIDAAGWMHTGDLATLDAAGYCNIVGRVKDMVIRGGENVYPREVEEYLYRHPKVQDVSVFGVPDAKYGEELAAWITLRAGERLSEEEVRAFCQGQIAHYKIPRYVRFVDAFPMTVTGKIQKFVMREAMAKELDIKEQKTA